MRFKKFLCLAMTIAVLLTALSATAFAASFTPSVNAKDAPTLVVSKDDPNVGGKIYDKSGNVVANITASDIKVTSVKSDASNANLTAAYNKLSSAASLSAVCSNLDSTVKKATPDVDPAQLVVKDLFYVSAPASYNESLKADGSYVSLTFNTGVAANEPFYVMVIADDGTCTMLDPANVTRNSDGTATLKLSSFGTVAFVTKSATTIPVDKENPDKQSPQTGWDSQIILALWVTVAICSALTISLLAISKNNKVAASEKAKK